MDRSKAFGRVARRQTSLSPESLSPNLHLTALLPGSVVRSYQNWIRPRGQAYSHSSVTISEVAEKPN